MMPKLSVIVPVYNSSSTLSRCIESLQRQTMSSLEIILVNDGSKDASGDICDKFASEDKRISVIHQENKGALPARVAGCKVARGEYICFVDSDDWVEENMLEQLCPLMEDVDMLASGVYRNAFDGSSMGQMLNVLSVGSYDLMKLDFWKGFYFPEKYVFGEYPGALFGGLWGKVFRREIILDFIDMLNVRIREFEDWLFNVIYLLRCKKIRVVDSSYYHYCAMVNSVKYSINLDFLSEQNLIYKIIKAEVSNHPAERILIKQIQKKFMYNIITITGTKMEFEDEALIPIWHFSRNDLLVNKKIVLFGAGSVGQSYFIDWKKRGVNVVGWIDNVPGKIELFGMTPERPELVKYTEFDYVVCGVKSEKAYKDMQEQMLEMGIDEQKILWDRPVYTWMEYFCN